MSDESEWYVVESTTTTMMGTRTARFVFDRTAQNLPWSSGILSVFMTTPPEGFPDDEVAGEFLEYQTNYRNWLLDSEANAAGGYGGFQIAVGGEWTESPDERLAKAKLKPLQLDILELEIQGKTNGEIAEILGIDLHKPGNQIAAIRRKLGTKDLSEFASCFRKSE
jgi:DNA-binding CsgD family transcriptional regulator